MTAKMKRREFISLLGGTAVSRIARAQAYTSRPVRIIVPFPAGGVLDL